MQASTRKVETHTLHSRVLGEERVLKVFVPPGAAGEALPVVYCHDGIEFFTHGRVATQAHEAILAGKLAPCYIVGIAVNLDRRRDDYAFDGARHREYLQFVADECIPFLDGRYAMDDGRRYMAGISLGAVATLSFVLEYPQWFHRVMLFSGAFFPPYQRRVAEAIDLSRLYAYMFIGEDERQAQTPSGVFDFWSYNEAMRDILMDRGADVSYHTGPGNHIWGVWQRHLVAALSEIVLV
ncbi:alpha/beta hydrolase [Alicyclobacillus mali (ex Roth et al. 2021)]|uniref:alpha/beta hydrolase n=1 Tax=Alicyclobacillus mali (ex Roth et al. 2021) TaxID=1123961 RepID=UPI001A8CE489|nr:alpha/beta hydrolase-fold protein [Alicyclobacillus mali (ex Roth et al. 2021)]